MDIVKKSIRKTKSIHLIKLPPGPDRISSRAASGPRATCLTPLVCTVSFGMRRSASRGCCDVFLMLNESNWKRMKATETDITPHALRSAVVSHQGSFPGRHTHTVHECVCPSVDIPPDNPDRTPASQWLLPNKHRPDHRRGYHSVCGDVISQQYRHVLLGCPLVRTYLLTYIMFVLSF